MFSGKAWIIDIKRFNLLWQFTTDKPLAPQAPTFGYFFLKQHNDKASVRKKKKSKSPYSVEMPLPPLFIKLFKKKMDWYVPKKNFGNRSESQHIPFALNIKSFLYRQGCLSSGLDKRVLCITGNVCKFWQDGDIITTKLY